MVIRTYNNEIEIFQKHSENDFRDKISAAFPYILLSIFTFFAGFAWPAGRIVALNISPISAAFYRYSLALPLFYFIHKKSQLGLKQTGFSLSTSMTIPREIHIKLAILGILGVGLYTVFFLVGISMTSGSDAALLFATTPTFTLFIGVVVRKNETLTNHKIVGVIAALVGIFIIFSQNANPDVSNRMLGNIFIILSAFVLAVYTVYSKPLFEKIEISEFNLWTVFYGWIFLLIFLPLEGNPVSIPQFLVEGDWKVIVALLYLGFFIVFATVAYSYGIKSLGAAKTSIFLNMIPIFGVLSSILLLGEVFSLWYLPAFMTILIGIYLVNKKDVS